MAENRKLGNNRLDTTDKGQAYFDGPFGINKGELPVVDQGWEGKALTVNEDGVTSLTTTVKNALTASTLEGGPIRLDPGEDPNPTGTFYTSSTFLFQSSSNTLLGYDLYFRQNGNVVKWKWFEGLLESGLLYGGVVTYSGSFVYVSPGSGIIVDHNAVTSSEIGPIVDYITWGPITQSITNIATQQLTYIYIDDTGSLQQQSTAFTPQQYHSSIPLGAAGHFDYNSVTAFGGSVQTSYDQVSQILTFVDAFGPLKISGYGITGQPSSLKISVGSGTSFIHGGFYDSNPQFPSEISTTSQLTASLVYVYRSGSGVRFDNNNNLYYTDLKPGFYDPGTGTTSSVSNNNWTIQRAYSEPKTGIVYVYYGQNVYTTYDEAVANVSSDSFTEGDTFGYTTFLGFLILKKDTTDITDTTENKIITAGLFRGGAGGAGGGSAVSSLDDLSDVSILSPTNGQALVYNSGTSLWVNGTPLTSSYALTASFLPVGTYQITSSWAQSASNTINAQTASFLPIGTYQITSSWAQSASNALRSISASRADTASFLPISTYQITSSWAQSASNAINAQTASFLPVGTYQITSSWAISASQALTASFLNGAFLQGGNSFGTTAILGTNDSQSLQFETSGSVRMTISSSGNVGIGTATPANTLEVNGGITATSLTASGAIINGNVTITGTASIAFLNVTYESASVIYSTGSNQFGDAANDTQTLYGSVIIPTGSLTVTGSTNITGSLNVTSGITGSLLGTSSWAINALTASFITPTGTNAFVQGGNSFGTTATLGTNDANNLILETNNTTRLFISSSGNVGIGTSSPTEKLHVDGNLLVTATTSTNHLSVNGYVNTNLSPTDATYNLLLGESSRTWNQVHVGTSDGTRTAFFGEDILNNPGKLFIRTDSDLVIRAAGGLDIQATTNINTLTNDTLTNNILITTPSLTATNLRATNSASIGGNFVPQARLHISGASSDNLLRVDSPTQANILFVSGSGNIGIGTTSPAALLDVNGNAIVRGALTASIISASSGITGSLFGTSSWAVSASQALTASFIAPTGNAFVQGGNSFGTTALLGTNDSQSLQFETSGSVRMTISSSGNIGIGTTTPTTTLNVSGTTLLQGGQTTVRGSGATSATTALRVENSSAAARLTILDDGTSAFNTSHLYVSGSSNVGIGTTNPQRRLHVDASGSANTDIPLLLTSVDANNRVGIRFASSSLSAGRQHSLFNRVSTPTAEWLLGTNAGETAQWIFIPRDDTNYAITLRTPFNGGTAQITTGLSQSLFSLGAGGTGNQHLNISSSGNIGIGTTTPTARLQIAGTPNDGISLDANNTLFNGVNARLPGRIIVGASSTGYPKIMYNAVPSASVSWSYAANDTAWAINMGGGNRMGFEYVAAGTAGTSFNSWNTIMVLVSGSNSVGIGTTSPAALLDVNGNAIVRGALTASIISASSNISSSTLHTTGNASVGDTLNVTGATTLVGALTASIISASSWISGSDLRVANSATVGTTLQVTGATTLTGALTSSNISASSNISSSTLHIVGSGSILGNVGIGTTTPTNTLQVIGGITSTNITASNLSASGNISASTFRGTTFTGTAPVGFIGTSSWAVSASFALTASHVLGQTFAAFTQSVAATTWTFNHNLNFRTPVITVYNSNYEVVIPDSIQGTSANQSVITFSTATAGYASATMGSILPQNPFALALAYAIVL